MNNTEKEIIERYLEKYMSNFDSHEQLKIEEKRLKALLNKINDENSYFKDFPYQALPLDEKVKTAYYILNVAEERQIMANVIKNDVDRNFENFIICDPQSQEKKSEFLKNHIQYESLNIPSKLISNRILIRNHKILNAKVIKKMDKSNEIIIREIFHIIESYKAIGVNFENLKCIEQYINYASDGILQFLVYRVMNSSTCYRKQEIFSTIITLLDSLHKSIDIQIAIKREEQLRKQNLTSEKISEYFVQFRKHTSRLLEEIEIGNVLSTEIKENNTLFNFVEDEFKADKVLLDDDEITVAKNIITEKRKVHEYEIKLKETQQFIELMQSYGGRNCYPNCLQDLKVYFREIYLSKSKYNGKQAMAIVREYLELVNSEGVQNFEKQSHYLFVREKISRGYFREKGLLDLYVSKIEIHNKLYPLLLKAYLFYDFKDCLEIIYSINNQIISSISDCC